MYAIRSYYEQRLYIVLIRAFKARPFLRINAFLRVVNGRRRAEMIAPHAGHAVIADLYFAVFELNIFNRAHLDAAHALDAFFMHNHELLIKHPYGHIVKYPLADACKAPQKSAAFYF